MSKRKRYTLKKFPNDLGATQNPWQYTAKELDRLLREYPGMVFSFTWQNGEYIHTFCNGQLLSHLNRSAHDMVGKTLEQILPEADAASMRSYYSRAWQGESVTYELQAANRRTYRFTLRPIVRDGKVVEVIGFTADVTEQKKAEEELFTAKCYLESFIQHTPDAISIRPRNSDILLVNKAFERLFGCTFEEYQQNWTMIMPDEETHQESYRKFDEVIATGEPVEYETYRKRKDGTLIRVHITYSPIRGTDGEIVGTAGIVRDITEKKRIEDALRESEAKYRILAENTSDIITIIGVDGKMKYSSPSTFQNLGYFPEKSIGMDILISIHRDDRDLVKAKFQRLLDGKESVQVEYRARHRDGRWIYFETRGVPVFDESGNVTSIVAVSRNITERKLAEEALRQSEQKYRLIAENTLDIIRLVDQHDLVVYASPSNGTVLGYQPEEIEGTPNHALVHPEDLEKTILSFTRVKQTKKPAEIEFRYQHKQGHYLLLEAYGIPLLTADGEISGTIMVARDITQRKRSEEIIRETEKLSVIGRLAAGIAHEIRNPLTSLKGFIQLLHAGSAENKHYYEIMEKELDRINYIVSELLVLSKPQVINYKEKNLNELIESVITLLDTQAILNNVQIKTDLEPSLPPIRCEENQIKQVFINLLKNSIEASPNGGEILIKTKRTEGGKVLVRIVDQGCGIPEEQISRLGEPFFTTK
jgi:two-component system sporulation sensor kinase A